MVKMLIGWSLVAMLGFGLFASVGKSVSPEMSSNILTAFGVFAALANTAYWQVVGRLNDPPIKDASLPFSEEIIRKYKRRRKSVFAKWVCAFLFAIVTAVGGMLLKSANFAKHYDIILFWSYLALSFTAVLGVLILIEYSILTRLARDIPRQREEQKRKTELLLRLQSDPTPPAVTPKAKRRRAASC